MKFILCFVFLLLIITNVAAFGDDATPRDIGFITKYIINADGQNFEIVFGSNFHKQYL